MTDQLQIVTAIFQSIIIAQQPQILIFGFKEIFLHHFGQKFLIVMMIGFELVLSVSILILTNISIISTPLAITDHQTQPSRIHPHYLQLATRKKVCQREV